MPFGGILKYDNGLYPDKHTVLNDVSEVTVSWILNPSPHKEIFQGLVVLGTRLKKCHVNGVTKSRTPKDVLMNGCDENLRYKLTKRTFVDFIEIPPFEHKESYYF